MVDYTRYDYETFMFEVESLPYSLHFRSTGDEPFTYYAIELRCKGSVEDVELSARSYLEVFNTAAQIIIRFFEDAFMKTRIKGAVIKVVTNEAQPDEHELHRKTKFYLLMSEKIKKSLSYSMTFVQHGNTIVYYSQYQG